MTPSRAAGAAASPNARTGSSGADVRTSHQARLDRAVRDVAQRSPFVMSGGGKQREIALTFDDGPGIYTPKVLSTLNRMNV